MKRKNVWIAVALILSVAVLSAVFLAVSRRSPVKDPDGNTAVISIGGREYRRISLSNPQVLTIRQDGGRINVIRVDENGIQMIEANCDNQHCVNTGLVSPENADFKPDGPFIICLPNQVSVELVVKE